MGKCSLEEPSEQQAHSRAKSDPQHDGYRDFKESRGAGLPALRHGGKGGKQHNHIDIIARCPGQNELGHAFFIP